MVQQDCVEKNKQIKSLKSTWADFAEAYVNSYTHGECWFATLTTQYKLTLPSARRAVKRFSDVVKRNGHHIALCWFAEKFELKDGYHLHALVSSTAGRDQLNEYWSTATRANKTHDLDILNDNNRAISESIFANQHNPRLRKVVQNRSDFRPLKRGLKGGAYASKYITKSGNSTDYDIVL